MPYWRCAAVHLYLSYPCQVGMPILLSVFIHIASITMNGGNANTNTSTSNSTSTTKRWEEAPVKLELRRGHHAAVVVDRNQILIMGGHGYGGKVLDLVEIIYTTGDIRRTPASLPKLPSGRDTHASVILN